MEVRMEIGYTMMCEQAPPRQLVEDVAQAEGLGFDFSVISDHYSPWLPEQGHSPYAWSVLGAAAWATQRIPLMTYVTCPLFRYHPAVIAQKAATMQLLSGGRFRLGLGAGENLNEHVIGQGWPMVETRHEMLREAVEIIRMLWTGGTVSYRGTHFKVDAARLWDCPPVPPELGVACSGPASCTLAGNAADLMIAIHPDPHLGELFDAAGGNGKPRVGQLAVAYDSDESTARKRAVEQFRWSATGWAVNAELPEPAGFDAASAHIDEEAMGRQMPCGPHLAPYIDAVAGFRDAGFTHLALVQVGGDQQQPFFDWYARELEPALAEAGLR
jgi:G6PDH family F420-dependent oxidoreductase